MTWPEEEVNFEEDILAGGLTVEEIAAIYPELSSPPPKIPEVEAPREKTPCAGSVPPPPLPPSSSSTYSYAKAPFSGGWETECRDLRRRQDRIAEGTVKSLDHLGGRVQSLEKRNAPLEVMDGCQKILITAVALWLIMFIVVMGTGILFTILGIKF